MTEAKRQHYVPQFYLRNFSVGSEGKAIGVFNIAGGKFIQCGSLRDQAYRDFFYGKDGRVERMFAKLEGAAAGILSGILRTNTLPDRQSEQYLQLLIFVMFLHSRTAYATEAMNELFDKTMKRGFSASHPEWADTLRRVALELRNPISWRLSMMEDCLPLVSDLRCRLLVNCTAASFVTSDNPVVLYNQFLESRKAIGSSTGLACKGLQVFLPLSPRHIILYYDGDVYKVGSKRECAVSIDRGEDVNALNMLQCASSHMNLYFTDSVTEYAILDLIQAARSFRPRVKAEVCDHPRSSRADGGDGLPPISYTKNIKCSLKLSFVSVIRKARNSMAGDKLRHVRDEAIFDFDAEFRDLFQRGIVRDGQFGYFLMTKREPYGSRARSIMNCFRNLAA